MEKYENLDNIRERQHLVEVTLQSGKYKGKFKVKVRGNCFGLDILQIIDEDIIFDIDKYECVDCYISTIGEDDDGQEWFRCILKADDGERCEIEDYCSNFKRLIIGINIIDCKIIK